MKTTQTFQPETLIVIRDGHLDDEYYDAIYAERKREVLHEAGQKAVQAMTTPIRNFSCNMLDLLREHTLTR